MKTLSFLRAISFGMIISSFFVSSHQAFGIEKASLTISAAVSLKPALEEIKTQFEKKHPKTSLLFNFGSSGSLQRQIENGASVDVFISASQREMDNLEKKRLLLNDSRRTLISNSLVLVIPAAAEFPKSFQDLQSPLVKKIAMGEPRSVPAGQYASEVFESLKIKKFLETKFVFASNARQVLSYLEMGEVDAGLIYATDALTSKKVKVIASAPDVSHSPIVYPAAVVKTSKQPKVAGEFILYLKGADANCVFTSFGFNINSSNL
jgi:molybdate transport system substrate-binding protein